MKSKATDSFWPSYTDLMTSLFFVMLVLYVLTYVRLSKTIKLQKEKLAIIEAVEQNLKPLKNDTSLFVYQTEFKRFKLGFDVSFAEGKSDLIPGQLNNYYQTIPKINNAGQKLKVIIDNLKKAKQNSVKLKNLSYIFVIAGYASNTGEEYYNYELSYKRALALKRYWKSIGIDFESQVYNELVDLQIAGNGWGGIGREKNDVENQRFLIQIFPKIGDIK